jgi:hypothetical protein
MITADTDFDNFDVFMISLMTGFHFGRIPCLAIVLQDTLCCELLDFSLLAHFMKE